MVNCRVDKPCLYCVGITGCLGFGFVLNASLRRYQKWLRINGTLLDNVHEHWYIVTILRHQAVHEGGVRHGAL